MGAVSGTLKGAMCVLQRQDKAEAGIQVFFLRLTERPLGDRIDHCYRSHCENLDLDQLRIRFSRHDKAGDAGSPLYMTLVLAMAS